MNLCLSFLALTDLSMSMSVWNPFQSNKARPPCRHQKISQENILDANYSSTPMPNLAFRSTGHLKYITLMKELLLF
jgi:hypothetical protein